MNILEYPTLTEVRRMWPGGPLRRWSQVKTPQTPLGYSEGFAGAYICGQCLEPCEGVYRLREPQKWVCGSCKRKLEPSGGERQ
jgi:hypothetical protein